MAGVLSLSVEQSPVVALTLGHVATDQVVLVDPLEVLHDLALCHQGLAELTDQLTTALDGQALVHEAVLHQGVCR